MVKIVHWPACKEDVLLRVQVVGHAPRHLREVLHIHVGIHDYHGLGQRQEPHTPESVHYLLSLPTILLFYRHDEEVVEGALGGHVHVHDLWKHHLDGREEQSFGHLAHEVVFRRWPTNHRGGVYRVFATCHSRDVEHRVLHRRGVVAGVVTEWALQPTFVRVDVPFKDDFSMGRDFKVDGLALH